MAATQNEGKSPELLELEKQAALLKVQKEIAEYNKEIATAHKGAVEAGRAAVAGPEVTPPTGDITSSDGKVFIETCVLAQKTLKNALTAFIEKFAQTEMAGGKPVTFVMHHASNFSSIELYHSLLRQVDIMEEALRRVNQATEAMFHKRTEVVTERIATAPFAADPLLPGFAIAGALRTAADIVSLFKTSTDYKIFDLTTDEAAIVAALKYAIQEKRLDWKVFYPAVYPVNIVKRRNADDSALLLKLSDVRTESDAAAKWMEMLNAKITELTSLQMMTPDDNAKKEYQEKIDEYNTALSPLKGIYNAFNQLQMYLVTENAATKGTPLAALLHAEQLLEMLNKENVYVLKVSAVSKGTNKITKSLWRSARIYFTAGTELNCLVFAPDGEVVFTDVRYQYTPYTRPDDI